MLTPHPDAEFIKTRAAKLAAAYNSRDVATALSMFADEGLEYSDYGKSPLKMPPILLFYLPNPQPHSDTNNHSAGVMALNMDKASLKKFLNSMFTTLKTLDLETVSVSGHKNFTAWEWKMHFTKNEGASDFEDINAKESKEGEVLTMLGISVTWWNFEGKIVKNHDYARFA